MAALSPQRPSSGQLGSAAEVFVAAQLMLASQGRLSCYAPLVDGDAVDLMVLDRVTGQVLGLQIKSWTFQTAARPRTVQFDVQKNTWRPHRRLYLLCATIDGIDYRIESAWVVPAAEVPVIARDAGRKYCLRPSTRADSSDRYSTYRSKDIPMIAKSLVSAMELIK